MDHQKNTVDLINPRTMKRDLRKNSLISYVLKTIQHVVKEMKDFQHFKRLQHPQHFQRFQYGNIE